MNIMFTSRGTLRFSIEANLYIARLNVDPQIVYYYRSLVPKSVRLNRQKFTTHVSVVRELNLPLINSWDQHKDEIEFHYDPYVFAGDTYWWINVQCEQLHELRLNLGLERDCWYTRPPDLAEAFHITIGNTKSLIAG